VIRVTDQRQPPSVGLNWKVHLYGKGSYAHSARMLLTQLAARDDVDLSAENLNPHLPLTVPLPAATAGLLASLAARRIDPRQFSHVRFATAQDGERCLLDDRMDLSPYGRNVWYVTPETAPFSVVDPKLYERVSQVWVPSEFSRHALLSAGVSAGLVTRVPLGVDTETFRPAEGARPNRPFTFLTVSNPHAVRRKGLDTLIRAYLAAFSPHDDVILVLHARKLGDVARALLDSTGYREGASPRVVVQDARVESMAELYRSVDCYLQPTRGESFGLAILEAMASGLPSIVTGGGGHMDFCGPETNLLIDYRLTPVDRDPERRGRWADPDPDHLVHLLRTAQTDAGLGRAVGRRARAAALDWSWAGAAGLAVAAASRPAGGPG
jgi:glycosyltransferase involved in cell wall biosynthesis